LFENDQAVIAKSEDNLWLALRLLNKICMGCTFRICVAETVMPFRGNMYLRAKILIANKVIEQVNEFKYWGCCISCVNHKGMYSELQDVSLCVELFDEQC
jgi:hypothetical protein